MNNPRVVVKFGVSRRDRALVQACDDWRGWSMILAIIACLIAVVAFVAVAAGGNVSVFVPLAFAMLVVIGLFVQNVVWPLHRRSQLIAQADAVILTAPYDQHYDEQMVRFITTKPADQLIPLQRCLVRALWNMLKEQARIVRANQEHRDGWEREILEASKRKEAIWGEYLEMVDSVADRPE